MQEILIAQFSSYPLQSYRIDSMFGNSNHFSSQESFKIDEQDSLAAYPLNSDLNRDIDGTKERSDYEVNYSMPEMQCSQRKCKAKQEKCSSKTLKKKISMLEGRIQELQRQNQALRMGQHQCQTCSIRTPHFYTNRLSDIVTPDPPNQAIDGSPAQRNRSSDSIEFEQADLGFPLLNTIEMEEKMWIFLGLTFIAMGSKVMNWDGTINSFKILKNSVDEIRRQVQRCDEKVSLQIFCSKQEIKPTTFIEGINYNPFYDENEITQSSSFLLDNIKLEAVQNHSLYYDFKYQYAINYEALLTIIQYAKGYCSIL